MPRGMHAGGRISAAALATCTQATPLMSSRGCKAAYSVFLPSYIVRVSDHITETFGLHTLQTSQVLMSSPRSTDVFAEELR